MKFSVCWYFACEQLTNWCQRLQYAFLTDFHANKHFRLCKLNFFVNWCWHHNYDWLQNKLKRFLYQPIKFEEILLKAANELSWISWKYDSKKDQWWSTALFVHANNEKLIYMHIRHVFDVSNSWWYEKIRNGSKLLIAVVFINNLLLFFCITKTHPLY